LVILLLTLPASIAGRAALAQDDATIEFWLDTTGGADTANCIIDNVINPFNEQSESIQVRATLQANGWDATRTALAGGAGPDVVVTPGPSFAYELAQAGQLMPLDDFAEEYGWSESFTPWALQLGIVNDQLYSIPSEVETLVLYYNATLFEENGWTPPTTLEELMALAEEIDAAGIIPFAHSNAEWRPANEWFVGEFLNHGAGPDLVYPALTGEGQWTAPALVSALETLNERQQNDWFMGGLDRYYAPQTATTYAMLAEGEVAMKIEGPWAVFDMNPYFGME